MGLSGGDKPDGWELGLCDDFKTKRVDRGMFRVSSLIWILPTVLYFTSHRYFYRIRFLF